MGKRDARHRQFLAGTRLLGLLAVNGIEERHQDSSEATDKLPLGFFGHFLGESIARCSGYRLNYIPNPLGDLELVRNNPLGMGRGDSPEGGEMITEKECKAKVDQLRAECKAKVTQLRAGCEAKVAQLREEYRAKVTQLRAGYVAAQGR